MISVTRLVLVRGQVVLGQGTRSRLRSLSWLVVGLVLWAAGYVVHGQLVAVDQLRPVQRFGPAPLAEPQSLAGLPPLPWDRPPRSTRFGR